MRSKMARSGAVIVDSGMSVSMYAAVFFFIDSRKGMLSRAKHLEEVVNA